MDANLSRSEALRLLDDYKTAYCDLVARAYIVIATYEKFLLDKTDHLELAEEMKAMLDQLPEEIIDGRPPQRPPQGPDSHPPPRFDPW